MGAGIAAGLAGGAAQGAGEAASGVAQAAGDVATKLIDSGVELAKGLAAAGKELAAGILAAPPIRIPLPGGSYKRPTTVYLEIPPAALLGLAAVLFVVYRARRHDIHLFSWMFDGSLAKMLKGMFPLPGAGGAQGGGGGGTGGLEHAIAQKVQPSSGGGETGSSTSGTTGTSTGATVPGLTPGGATGGESEEEPQLEEPPTGNYPRSAEESSQFQAKGWVWHSRAASLADQDTPRAEDSGAGPYHLELYQWFKRDKDDYVGYWKRLWRGDDRDTLKRAIEDGFALNTPGFFVWAVYEGSNMLEAWYEDVIGE